MFNLKDLIDFKDKIIGFMIGIILIFIILIIMNMSSYVNIKKEILIKNGLGYYSTTNASFIIDNKLKGE